MVANLLKELLGGQVKRDVGRAVGVHTDDIVGLGGVGQKSSARPARGRLHWVHSCRTSAGPPR